MPREPAPKTPPSPTPLLTIWRSGFATFPGLMQFELPADPEKRDRYIRDTLRRVRSGLERDLSDQVRWVFRETGAERARTRRLVLRLVRQTKEALRLDRAAFRACCMSCLPPDTTALCVRCGERVEIGERPDGCRDMRCPAGERRAAA